MKPENDPHVITLVHHGTAVYLKVKEVPGCHEDELWNPCRHCVAFHDEMDQDSSAWREACDLCHALPPCSNGVIFIRPEDLDKYKVEYVIGRMS